MTPLRSLLPAALRGVERLSRRDVLRYAGAVGVSAATWVGCETVKIAAERTILDPLFADGDPVPHMRMDLGMREFDRLASPAQKAAWEGIKLSGTVPDLAADRCTELTERDGDMWVVDQGREVGAILWGKPVLGRMADRPDRTFGRWRAECIRFAGRKSDPTFELVRAVVGGRAHRYTALVVPGRTIRVVTARDEAKPTPARESTAPTTHPGLG